MGRFHAIVTLVVFLPVLAMAQSRVTPGKMYEPGEAVVSAAYGIESVVPEGWMGVLPMDTEIFLLMPLNHSDGQIYVTADTSSYEEIKAGWMRGLSLDNGNVLRSNGDIFERGDGIASEVVLVGGSEGKGYRAYIEGKCSDFGVCIVYFLVVPEQHFESGKKGLQAFADNTNLVRPDPTSIYSSFDWKGFLANKYLASFEYQPGAKSENEIWLCGDGTFRSKLKRGPELKAEGREYQGKKNGTWKTTSVGQDGMLQLTFKNLTPIEVPLRIEEDRIFINGRRHYALLSDKCR